MEKYLTIADLREAHRRRTPKMFYDYADSGSYTEGTYRENEVAFSAIKLRQRVARNIDKRDLSSTILGKPVTMPVYLAPVGMTGMQHADGEILAARAAEKFGIPFCLSTMSICSLEDIAAATKAPFVFNGSADGCSWTAPAKGCNNGWTMAGLYQLAGGLAPTRIVNLPQIYNTTMPKQWKYISLTGVNAGSPRINFGGPLTEWTACDQAGGCGSITGLLCLHTTLMRPSRTLTRCAV